MYDIDDYYHTVVSHREGEGLNKFLNQEQPAFMRDSFQLSIAKKKGDLRDAARRYDAISFTVTLYDGTEHIRACVLSD